MRITGSHRFDVPQRSTIDAKAGCVSSEFRPLGIRLTVDADRPELLAAAAAACRGWEGDADGSGIALHLSLVLGQGICSDGDPEIRVEGRCLWICGGGVDAEADAGRGSARCAVSEDHLADPEALCADVLDPLLLFLLTRSGRAPVHAAGLLAGDLAILLAGPSGSGKSCLALAARTAGFRLISDDIVYVQLRPALRVWGAPRPIHVFPEDAPAGRDEGALRLRNGKLKRAIPIAAGAAAVNATRAVLCVLERGSAVSLAPISQADPMCGLLLEPGFDLLRSDVETAFEALTRNGAWRLTLSADPDDAIALIGRSLRRLGATASP